jgi:predicted nucleic acid-binding protein
MKVLIDTSIWSLALRKKILTPKEQISVMELKELIFESRTVIIGSIRQELLSGISEPEKFTALKNKMEAFEDLNLTQVDYENAAELCNICRKNGVQGSHTDFLICAVAIKRGLAIFTVDRDFENFAQHINLNLHQVRSLSPS